MAMLRGFSQARTAGRMMYYGKKAGTRGLCKLMGRRANNDGSRFVRGSFNMCRVCMWRLLSRV